MLALFSTVFYVDKQKILWTDICSAKEVGYVKKDNASMVRCEYTASEKQLPQLLEESFYTNFHLNHIIRTVSFPASAITGPSPALATRYRRKRRQR